MRETCQLVWNLGKMCTIDELMIRYKAKYCATQQYMPKKPIKWGLKLWCVACATSKFIWNFEVYCDKSGPTYGGLENVRGSGDANMVEGVVPRMVEGMENKGHVVVMDNYFTSMGLLKKLLERGIYATSSVQNNCMGLPRALCNTKAFHRNV